MKDFVEEMQDVLEQARYLKGSAKTNRDFEDYEEALDELNESTDVLLEPRLKNLETKGPEQVEQYEKWRYELARELADCYGMKGGLYRRKGDLENAEMMYKEGSRYERDYKIPDSYNRTNAIVLQLLRDPNLHETLQAEIREARESVQEQVEGKRRDEWWAWADLGMLYLLEKNHEGTQNLNKACGAYEQFKNKGARKHHFESSISVLQLLKEHLEEVNITTASQVQEAIAYLERSLPAR